MIPSANGKSTVAWSRHQPCTVLEWLQHTTKAQGFWSHIMIWAILSPARNLDVPMAFSLHPVDIYRSCWMFLEDFMGFHPFWSNGSSVFDPTAPFWKKTSTARRRFRSGSRHSESAPCRCRSGAPIPLHRPWDLQPGWRQDHGFLATRCPP